MLKLKAHCIQFVPNTVIKSDPLLTKLIICLGKEGAWLSRHPEYPCTHTGNATAINTELPPYPKAQIQHADTATLVQPESYYCLNLICFSRRGKRKTNGITNGYKLHLM